jgi:flavin-dependent dehydrogenase
MFQVTGDRNIIGTTARAGESPGEATELFMKLPYFASWFRKARIIKKLAFGSSGYHLPLKDPVVGKVLILGEAAGVNETSNPGAIACGYQAAKATVNEMNGKNGYRDYTTWWQKSFEGNDPDYYKAAGRFFSINALCSDVEVDYLYGLIEGQIGVPAVLIARNLERMKGDQPELYEKLKKTGMDKGVSDIKLDWGTVIAKPGKPKA